MGYLNSRSILKIGHKEDIIKKIGGYFIMFILMGSLLLVTALILLLLLIRYSVEHIARIYILNSRSTVDLFSELDTIIENEFNFAVNLPYTSKNYKVVTDFHGTVVELVSNVKEAIEPEFIHCFRFKGISEKYVTLYIVRRMSLILIKYMETETNKR